MDLHRYTEGREAAPLALVGDLVEQLAHAESTAVYEADGLAVLTDGRVLDWRDKLDRPTRRRGHVNLDDPASFVSYLNRLGTADTMLYANLDAATITAVLNDHPEYVSAVGGADDVVAGRRDDIAELVLRNHPDWTSIVSHNGRLLPQREFAELIEDLAHRVSKPDSATMLEVASTLNVRQNIDFSSRHRTQSGDTEFRFEQTSEARAGRGGSVEIPTVIAFRCPVWQGTDEVEIEARLRFRASGDGCVMGYRLIMLSDVVDEAFRGIVSEINGEGVAPDILFGDAMVSTMRRTR